MRCFSQMPQQTGSKKAKEASDQFKNRFKKFTGPTEKRFKKIEPAELRQFVLEALGEQKAGEKLSDVGDDEGKLVEVAWQVRQAGINGQIILVDEDESDSETFSSDDSEDSDSKGGQQSRDRGKAAKGKPTRKAREIEVQEPDYSLLMSISWGKNYSSLQVVPKKMQVLQDVKLGPQVYGCAEGDLAEFVLRKAVGLVALHRAVLECLEAHAQASAMHRGVDGTTDG